MARILLVRVDGIGDALACTPLLAALRAAGHSVSALLTTRNAQIFAKDALENVHVVERIPWPKHGYTPETFEPALAAARAAGYDIALIPSEEPQAYAFARAAGIPKRAGFYNGWQKPFKSWWARRQLTDPIYRPAAQPEHPAHEVDVMFRLGDGLHEEAGPTKERDRLRALILDAEIPPSDVAAIQVTQKWLSASRDPSLVRSWFREVVQAGKWIGICSESERDLGVELGEAAGLPVEYFCSVGSWKERIAGAAHLLTPDTGAAHVAGMLGVPCTDLFETHNYAAQVAQWSPWVAASRLRTFEEWRPGE